MVELHLRVVWICILLGMAGKGLLAADTRRTCGDLAIYLHRWLAPQQESEAWLPRIHAAGLLPLQTAFGRNLP